MADQSKLFKQYLLRDPLIRHVIEADGIRISELSDPMASAACRREATAPRLCPEVFRLDDIECRSDPRFEPCSRLLRMECSWTMH